MPSQTTLNETLRSPIDGTESVRLATTGANWRAPLSTVFSTLGRIKATSTVTIYVRSDGADSASRTGLVNDSANAFLTFTFAIAQALQNYDFNTQGILIQAGQASQTWTANANVASNWVGGGTLFLDFNSGTLTVTGGNAISTSLGIILGGNVTVQNVTISTVTSGNCIDHEAGGHLIVGSGVTFAACAFYQLYSAGPASYIEAPNNYTISAGAQAHVVANGTGAIARINANTVTLSGTPNFSTAFAWGLRGGVVFVQPTFSGSATGQRWLVGAGGGVETFGQTLNTYLPGNSNGGGNNIASTPSNFTQGWAE